MQTIRVLHPSVAMSPQVQCLNVARRCLSRLGCSVGGGERGEDECEAAEAKGIRVASGLRLRLAERSRSRRRTFILPEPHGCFASDL